MPPDATVRPWLIRVADLDVLGHMNNAAHWAAVEEALDRPTGAMRAELEHGVSIGRHDDVSLHVRTNGDRVETWLTTEGSMASVARVSPLTG